jgi:hypothetical protein
VAPTSAELSTVQASSGTRSVRFPGTTTNSQSRNKRTIAETGVVTATESIVWSFDFYDGAPTGNPQKNYCVLQDGAGTSTNQLVSMGLYNNQLNSKSGGQYYMARIVGYTVAATDPDGGSNEDYTGSSIYFKLNDFGVGKRSVGWHNLKVIISTDGGASTDYAFYVDNALAEKVSNVGSTLRSYDAIQLGSGNANAGTEAFVDNMKLQIVPEPATMILLAMGGLLISRRRRVA